MNSISRWQQLEPYGIVFLAREAWGLSHRLLCDVAEKGRRLLGKVPGIPQMTLGEAWNRGSEKEPHVGSILLPSAMHPTIAIVGLLKSGHDEACLCKNGTVIGLDASDDQGASVGPPGPSTARSFGRSATAETLAAADPELAALLDAWLTLAGPIRAAIPALVQVSAITPVGKG